MNRRNFVGVLTGGLVAIENIQLATGQTLYNQKEVIGEIKSGDGWLRIIEKIPNEFQIITGHRNKTIAVYDKPVGICWYRNNGNLPDGERRVAWNKVVRVNEGNILWHLYGTIEDTDGSKWEAATAVKKDETGFRLITTFTRHGKPRAASVRVHTQFTAKTSDSYTLYPGAIYNGNKADVVVPRHYCPMLTNLEVSSRESKVKRRLISDIPRLDASTWYTAHLWGYQSASASVSVFDKKAKTGIHLGYARKENNRVTGVIHTADPVTNFHQVTIENPCVRHRRFQNCTWVSSPDRPYMFNDGETAIIELRLMPVSENDIPSFITSWCNERELRRKGLAPGQNGTKPQTPDVMPRSHATSLAINWNDQHLWEEEKGYYRTIHHNENHPRELILGWGSGTMTMWPMFLYGTTQIKNRIRSMTRFIIDHAQAPGGLYYGVMMKDGKWITADGNLDFFWAMNGMTARRTTDTVFYGMHLADALRKENGEGDLLLATKLDESLYKACEALQRVWIREGNIPFLLNPSTEKTVWPGAFGGARAIGCLVNAYKRFKQIDFLNTAEVIAKSYVRDGLYSGETWGGPSDIMQGIADNESLTALAEGLTLLYAVTKKIKHLLWAKQAADLLATWVLDEMIEYPAKSVLGKNGVQPFGALIANTQNAWGTPGLCVNSGKFLLDLYEFTGEERFMNLLSDIVRLPLQMMVRPGQNWGDLEPGQMTECTSFNDVQGEFGEAYVNAATWPVNAMLLGEVELPSVYVDGNKIWRLDHIGASLDANGNLTLQNTTAFDATVKFQKRGAATTSIHLQNGETKKLSI